MTTAQVVETSVSVNNSPILDYVNPNDHTQPTYEWLLGSNLSQRTVSLIIHFSRKVEDRETYYNVSPHQTKGMTTDSDNQIPTDYLLYNLQLVESVVDNSKPF